MTSILVERANRALKVNPPRGVRVLTTNGSNWLWAVFAVFLLFFLIHAVMSLRPRHRERIFPYIFTIVLLAGTITYFSQASGLGSFGIHTSCGHTNPFPTYQIFWPKYAFWAVAFPAIVLVLGLLGGMSWASILFGIVLAWTWVLNYFFAAMTGTSYKWGFFVLGTLTMFGLAILILTSGRKHASTRGVASHYHALAGWTNFIWVLYPIAFGVSDGGNLIGPTPAFIFFGILDLLLLPVITTAFFFLAKRWDHHRLGFNFTQNGRQPIGGGYGAGEFAGKSDGPGAVAGALPGHGGEPATSAGTAVPGMAMPPIASLAV